MSDLIKALQIFLKYGDPANPTHCEHDELTVAISPKLVSQEDIVALEKLSFHANNDHFYSYRFGSC